MTSCGIREADVRTYNIEFLKIMILMLVYGHSTGFRPIRWNVALSPNISNMRD